MNAMSFLTFFRRTVVSLLLSGSMAHAASISGTVINKTNGKPSPGDSVVLIDVQAGMAEAASTTTDAQGHYVLDSPGGGAYLVRVNHQGGTYFIAAPQGGTSGDVTVYDVAARVDGVGIDADMILPEAAGGMVRVQERFLVRNTSLPPRAQFSSNTFEFVLPADAVLDGASATRPGGLATNTRPVPLPQKGHYSINVPIQPDQDEKETLFEVQYHLTYNGTLVLSQQPLMPADNVVAYIPKGMTFTAANGSSFQPTQEDPRVQTFVAKNIRAGEAMRFTISGEGQMPRNAQGPQGGTVTSAGMGDATTGDSSSPSNAPGGGIGSPIDTPDPLTKYKWWILGGLALLLAAGATFLLRKQNSLPEPTHSHPSEDAFESNPVHASAPIARPAQNYPTPPKTGDAFLLNVLKEELFAIEKEKLSGALSQEEYAHVKVGLEALLKRTLKNAS
jgi:hypothetical protein